MTLNGKRRFNLSETVQSNRGLQPTPSRPAVPKSIIGASIDLTVGLLAVLVCATAADAGVIFSDDFEAPAFNSFWDTQVTSNGVLGLSSQRARSGSQSLRLESFSPGRKTVSLQHHFAQPVFGEFSVWMFDTGADVGLSNVMGLFLVPPVGTPEHVIYVFGESRDLGPGNGGQYRYVFDNRLPLGESMIDRTQDWHELSILTLPDELTFRVDGQIIHTQTHGLPISEIGLSLFADGTRPGFTTFFDDFRFVEATTAVPEPVTLAVWCVIAIVMTVGLTLRRFGSRNLMATCESSV